LEHFNDVDTIGHEDTVFGKLKSDRGKRTLPTAATIGLELPRSIGSSVNATVIQEACVQGVSTRSVDDLSRPWA
jgi:hypothetical protein